MQLKGAIYSETLSGTANVHSAFPHLCSWGLGGPSKEAIFRLQPCLLLICGHKRGERGTVAGVGGGMGVIRGECGA